MSARKGGRSAKAKDRATSKECQEREQAQVAEQQRRQRGFLWKSCRVGRNQQQQQQQPGSERQVEQGIARLGGQASGGGEGGGGRWLPESPRWMTNCD